MEILQPHENAEKAEQIARSEKPAVEAEPEGLDAGIAPSERAVSGSAKAGATEDADKFDPVEWLLEDKMRWPAEVKLAKSVRFPVIFRGRAAGTVVVPAGNKVEVSDIGPDFIGLRFGGGSVSLPHGETDLAALIPELMQREQFPAATDGNRLAEAAVAADDTGQLLAPARLVEAAKKIDDTMAVHYAKNRLRKPLPAGDGVFLRRAYLSAIGRIPTAEEAVEFLNDKNPHKRANLVAALVETPGYASHMANWMFDRLRIVDHNTVAQIRYPLYRRWVRRAVDEDTPWDEVVTKLLTTNGGGWDDESTAIGYFTRDRGMPLDNLAVTMRIFLGSRMECAQCHNDPFGDTKQKDFFRLAAFTNGLGPKNQDLFAGIYRQMSAMPPDSVENRAATMFWRDIYGSSLAGGGTGRIALPMDYRYKDARPGDIKGARAPFGKRVSVTGTRDRDDGRQKLAGWITQGTEERFAGMIANNMWRRVMGAGYFEPGDDYTVPADTHEPLLARQMAVLMKDLGYSLRDFQLTLMLTEAFQYEPNPAASVAVGGADDFRGRRVQRMSAEQVWDSLVTLVSGNPDNQPTRAIDERIYVGGRPVLEGQMTMGQLASEVLAIEDEDELRDYFLHFVKRVKSGVRGEEGSTMAAMRRNPVGFVRGMHPRASELDSPVPRDHFVALFGQSTRNVVDGSTREPNLGQALSLMNGFVQTELINVPDAYLNRDIALAATPEEKIRQLCLAIFSREPSEEEVGLMKEEFLAAPDEAAANVASAMIMSAEFLYVQ